MTIQSRCAAAFLISIFGVVACGSSGTTGAGGAGGSAGGTTGSAGTTGTGGTTGASALQVACRAFCQSEGDHNCHSDPATTTDMCMSYRCPPAGEANTKESCPSACKTAWIAYWACLVAQQKAGTATADDPAGKPGCGEPGSCATQAAAVCPASDCP